MSKPEDNLLSTSQIGLSRLWNLTRFITAVSPNPEHLRFLSSVQPCIIDDSQNLPHLLPIVVLSDCSD
jgi:hypothetical protein